MGDRPSRRQMKDVSNTPIGTKLFDDGNIGGREQTNPSAESSPLPADAGPGSRAGESEGAVRRRE